MTTRAPYPTYSSANSKPPPPSPMPSSYRGGGATRQRPAVDAGRPSATPASRTRPHLGGGAAATPQYSALAALHKDVAVTRTRSGGGPAATSSRLASGAALAPPSTSSRVFVPQQAPLFGGVEVAGGAGAGAGSSSGPARTASSFPDYATAERLERIEQEQARQANEISDILDILSDGQQGPLGGAPGGGAAGQGALARVRAMLQDDCRMWLGEVQRSTNDALADVVADTNKRVEECRAMTTQQLADFNPHRAYDKISTVQAQLAELKTVELARLEQALEQATATHGVALDLAHKGLSEQLGALSASLDERCAAEAVRLDASLADFGAKLEGEAEQRAEMHEEALGRCSALDERVLQESEGVFELLTTQQQHYNKVSISTRILG